MLESRHRLPVISVSAATFELERSVLLSENSSATSTRVVCTCVSVVKVYRYFETGFNSRESRQHDVTRVFSGPSSWKHEALPVVRRLDQSENETTYRCTPPVCVKTLTVAF